MCQPRCIKKTVMNTKISRVKLCFTLQRHTMNILYIRFVSCYSITLIAIFDDTKHLIKELKEMKYDASKLAKQA